MSAPHRSRERRRAGGLVLLFGLLALAACNHRSPVPGADSGQSVDGQPLDDWARGPEPDGPIYSLDGFLNLPDGFRADGYTPEVCKKESVTEQTFTDPRGNFTLVLPQLFTVQAVTFSSAASVESAAAATYGEVSALVATRAPEKTTASDEMQAVLAHLLADLSSVGGVLSARSQGTSGTSAEGFAEVKEAVLDVTTTAQVSASQLRNLVLASLLLRKPSALSGLPSTTGATDKKLVLRMSLAYRSSQQVAISGAVMLRSEHDVSTSSLPFLAVDLSNGTALAKAGRTTTFECDVGTIQTTATADIIWVVDESGSMDDNRQDIVKQANAFFTSALAAGLDFRMGVTSVISPDTSGAVVPGKFCSRISSNQSDDGGDDRFLEPSEQAIFSSCVQNPPYYEGGSEFGLTATMTSLQRHLPRTTGSKTAIRKGAKLAIIIATDEAAMEVKLGGHLGSAQGFIPDSGSPPCTLVAKEQAQLKTLIAPVFDLVTGKTDPEAQATVHLIGGTCKSTCGAEFPIGYHELVAATGGQSGDVCQKNLSSTLDIIIKSIVGSASPRVLKYVPITSSLSVEANGVKLSRSRVQGFDYDAQSNSLSFFKVKVQKGNLVVASYRRYVK